MRIFKQLVFSLLIISELVNAQSGSVSGTVSDADGPLPGASVVMKGTNSGVTTDFDGNFSISGGIDNNSILVFSYVGYESQEIVVGNQSIINVQMQEAKDYLDEVVVIGYGSQKKSVVTGAISSIKQSELKDIPITRVEQTLQEGYSWNYDFCKFWTTRIIFNGSC